MAGVYRIRNTVNGKVYIGSTVRTFLRRWNQHRKCLDSGTHHSTHLQSAWNRYGEAAFVFERVIECAATECVRVEQEQIDDHKSANREYGYNASPTAGNCLGVKHSEKARANMSAASIGKPKSPEAIAKTAAAHRGRPKPKEQRENRGDIAGKDTVP